MSTRSGWSARSKFEEREITMMESLRSCALAVAVFGAAASASAQNVFPERALRIVVGFPASSTADIVARHLAPRLSEGLGQAVVVDARPGAGSAIAAEAVARSSPDGHTLLLSTIANTILANFSKLSFDFRKDFAPISLLAETPGLLAAHPSAPHSVKELIAAAKARPGELAYASAGTGTVTHLYGELFNLQTGVKLTHIPYKGSGQAQTDLLSGQIKLLFTPAATLVPHIKAGRLIALGSIGPARLSAVPGVPRLVDAGGPGVAAGLGVGLNAPAATPAGAVARLTREPEPALAEAEVRRRFADQNLDPLGGSSERFGALIAQETEKWARVVKMAGIKGE
ncbi:MAG: tripartite tricarboxylate transporter substrate binding protein [Burkholderiales bacterium]|nr:tripartite tricarboxylate transporter substrate binding protein [Burkholderiales bacterium]